MAEHEGTSAGTTVGLRPKGPGHDQRRCRFLTSNPACDRAGIPEGVDRTRLPLFLCSAKGAERPLITTMRKCKFCRETNLWYQPREEVERVPAQPPAGSDGARP